MKRRFFGIILSVVLVIGLLPANFAAGATVLEPANDPVPRFTPLDLTGEVSYRDNNGNQVTSDASLEDIGNSGEGWSWNAASKTLTLDGVRIACTQGNEGIRLPAGATLVLAQDSVNLVRSCDGEDTTIPYANAALVGEGALLLSGTGTMLAAGGSTIDTGTASYGLFLPTGNLTVEGGDWTFLGGETGTPSTHGIYLEDGNLAITAGSVTAKGGSTTIGGNSYGIWVNGNFTLSGGDATGLGGTASWTSRGILLSGNLIQSGGVLTGCGGTALEADGDSAGLYLAGSVNLNNPAVPGSQDGKLNLMGGSADTSVALDMTLSDVNIYGGQVFLSSGKAVDLSMGLRTQGTIYLTGGTTVVQATPGATLSQALNQPASFGTSSVSVIYPTNLPPGDSAYEQSFNVYGPAGSLAFRNAPLVISSGTASFGDPEVDGFGWDSASKTLTLTGLCLVTDQSFGISLPAGVVVQTTADTVNIAKLTATLGNTEVLYGNGNLELKGQGGLMLLASNATSWSEALYLSSGSLTVTDGDLTSVGASATLSAGIHTSSGSVSFNGGTVFTAGGQASNYSFGINSEEIVTIAPGARVVALSGSAVNDSQALVAEGAGIAVNGGDLLASAGYSSAANSIAVQAGDGDMTVSGGIAKALSGGCSGNSYGIRLLDGADPDTYGAFRGSAGIVFTSSGGIGNRNYAIECAGNLYQTGGQLLALATKPGTISGYAFGAYADTATLEGGGLTALGAYAKYSTGLAATLELLGGQTVAVGANADTESNGVQGPTMAISGGELWAISGNASFTRGLFIYTDLYVQHSGEVYLRSGDSGGSNSHALWAPFTPGSIVLNGGRLEAMTQETAGDGEALIVLPDLSAGGMILRSGAPDAKQVVYLENCTVQFDSQGGTAVSSTNGDYGQLVEAPEVTPTKTGYLFSAWQWHNPKTGLWQNWDFTKDRIPGDMVLQALWLKSVSTLTVSAIDKKTYTGSEIKPLPVVKDGTKTLTLGVDYTLSYTNNIKPGKATLTLTGKGSYTGKTTSYFYIVPKALSSITLTLNPSYPDSTLRYRAIKATWTPATGATGYLVRYRRSTTTTWSSAYVSSSSWSMLSSYSGAKYYVKVIPYVTVSGTRYYSSSYSPEKSVYTLKAPTLTLAKYGSTSIKVSWTNIPGETGYRVYRKTGSSGTWVIAKNIASSSATYWIDTGRTPGRTYYYRVRAYRTVGTTSIFGPISYTKGLTR